MSTFLPAPVTCPHCGSTVEANVARTVNAQRSPEYRDQILRGDFQLVTCQLCGEAYRFDHSFVYIDLDRGQWISCFALRDLERWRELEGAATRSFALACGPRAPRAAQELGAGVEVRTVFGYGALVEKILCLSAGIDDAELELGKLTLARDGLLPLARPGHRLVAIDETSLTFADERSGADRRAIPVPDLTIDDARARDACTIMRAGPFVDATRLLDA